MLRTTRQRLTATQSLRVPAVPGPVLQGWGRTAQKRRLEYESHEAAGHMQELGLIVDHAGLQTRVTDPTMVRTYFMYPQRMLTFFWNFTQLNIVFLFPASVCFVLYHAMKFRYYEVIREAWW